MKKLSILMLSICMMGTLQSNAQFGKLLGKVTGGGKSAGKKSGNFSTVWE
jgi:hypothetical protein